MKKQMNYANQRQIPYVAIIGEQERIEGKITLKNMTNGEQRTISLDEITL